VTNRRELLLLLALFGALIGFAIFGPRPRSEAPQIPGSTHTSSDEGALALLRWLDELGYDAGPLEYQPFRLDDSVDVLFVLNPSDAYMLEAADELAAWVEAGGTLIVAHQQNDGRSGQLLPALGVSTDAYSETITSVTPAQPVLDQPLVGALTVETDRVLAFDDDDYVKLAGPPEAMVLAGRKFGNGYVYLSSALRPFTNAGLRDAGSGALILNMLRRAPPGARVLFDEYHHGFFEPPSTRTALLQNPWGQAGLYITLLLLLYLLLTARRFGAPVPLPEEAARRSSAEYVDSMAGLLQRGGQRAFVLRHFYAAFKRRLARPYGVNPKLDDAAFVAELARYRPLDQQALLTTLTAMRRDTVAEGELVRLLGEADALSETPR
jgi:hypothetical protein